MNVKRFNTSIPDCILVEPLIHEDDRGFFMESWNEREFAKLGIEAEFVQDNHSSSVRGVLRGLHYQIEDPQGKLIRVTRGSVFDVAVDLRKSSPYFGKWMGLELSEDNRRILWVPPGFAHGFYVTSETAEFQYKCTSFYSSEHDRAVKWDDPEIGIDWPLLDDVELILSKKDQKAPSLADAEVFS